LKILNDPGPSQKYLKIKEVVPKRALNPDPYPGWDFSLNPYTGCYHACPFCYVPDVIHADRGAWGKYINVKRTLPNVLSKEVKTQKMGVVGISSATDPYQPIEKRFEITRRCLEVLLGSRWPISILTRSPLVERDIDIIHSFTQAEVGLSIPTVDDNARKVIEPLTPSISSRLRSVKMLADAGVRTYICYAPAYPPTGSITVSEIAEKLASTGCEEIYIDGLKLRPGVRDELLKRMTGSPLRAQLEKWTNKDTMGSFLRELKTECKKQGLSVTGVVDYTKKNRLG